MDDDARGLIDDEQVVILVDEREGGCLHGASIVCLGCGVNSFGVVHGYKKFYEDLACSVGSFQAWYNKMSTAQETKG